MEDVSVLETPDLIPTMDGIPLEKRRTIPSYHPIHG